MATNTRYAVRILTLDSKCDPLVKYLYRDRGLYTSAAFVDDRRMLATYTTEARAWAAYNRYYQNHGRICGDSLDIETFEV